MYVEQIMTTLGLSDLQFALAAIGLLIVISVATLNFKYARARRKANEQAEFSDEVIARIEQTVAAWRGDSDVYEDVAGYCRSVSLAELAKHGHVLTPGRYVGAEEVEDDDEAFADKMQKLTEKLGEQMAQGAELDAVIKQKLGSLGYEF